MIYKLRLKLATVLFELAKHIHPDLAILRQRINKAKQDMICQSAELGISTRLDYTLNFQV